MAILVTGGAGYIGSAMVERLLASGRSVVVLDNLSRGHRSAVPSAVPLEIGDVGDPAFVGTVFDTHPIEAVFHFAADSLVGESMTDPGKYFRNNVGGVLTLLETMARHSARRFVLSSTAATYGDPAEVPITETAPTEPTNPYGESKLICERLLRWFGRVHGIRWTSLRYFNAAGATPTVGEDHSPETHLIPLALDAAFGRRDPLRVFGLDYPTPDGTCVRDYIHIEDLADAHLLALEYQERAEWGIFNLGNGQGFSVLEVIESVSRVSGRRVPWEPAERRPGDPPRLVASSERARKDLGWSPKRDSLDEIIASALRWSDAHPNGYGD
ncbi:MAG: UDP-glucose 4-epimerase GalE [Candidatus Eisenbacteria bacterium]